MKGAYLLFEFIKGMLYLLLEFQIMDSCSTLLHVLDAQSFECQMPQILITFKIFGIPFVILIAIINFCPQDMDGMVEENGNHESDPLEAGAGGPKGIAVTCVQSVIQPNQQSVIQSATGGLQPTVLTKGNVILVSKPNSVIQTPQGSLQTLQVVVEARGAADEDSLSPRDTNHKAKRHHELLGHNPARRKQLLDDGLQAATADIFPKVESSGSDDCDSNIDGDLLAHSISVAAAGGHHYQSVLATEGPTTSHLHLASQSKDVQGLPTITMTTAGAAPGAGTILHYAGQDGQFFVPGEIVVMQNAATSGGAGSDSSGGGCVPEDQAKKREIRLLKNREAARECRRKKKEYIKCLENRVAVLEAQNKALIDELKSLKELYCSQKTE